MVVRVTGSPDPAEALAERGGERPVGRWVEVDGKTVSDAARSFGFSRPSFYHAQTAFAEEGLVAPDERRSLFVDRAVAGIIHEPATTSAQVAR